MSGKLRRKLTDLPAESCAARTALIPPRSARLSREIVMLGVSRFCAQKQQEWETVPVSNAAFPEEALREQMNRCAVTGERYDYVTSDGDAAHQP